MEHRVLTEEVLFPSADGELIEGFLARPLDAASHGSMVVIHHMPGYDEATKEIAYRFARHGYASLMPNLYWREAPGAAPDEAAAIARAAGGVPDDRLVADVAGARAYLLASHTANERVGVIGYCSGGRQSFLAACSLPFDAAVDCYGAFVVAEPPEGAPLTVRPLLDRAPNLSAPLLGLFGAEDRFPSPEEVRTLDEELTRLGKRHEFHTYAGAGHAFFNTASTSYRPEAAQDGWRRILDFLSAELG
jgi:carboxymethylenebutenolidase